MNLFRRRPKTTPTQPVNDEVRRQVLSSYVHEAPSPQVALDIFKGSWSSRLPGSLSDCQAGTIPLFDDHRIEWLLSQIDGVSGQTVLELGPLEGGHSYMLEQAGAASVTAIESNTGAFLRCLITKELLGLNKVHFLCGDFVAYLRETDSVFDVGLASGVLYHMQNPLELIALLARHCKDKVFLWTHYYDQAILSANEGLRHKFKVTSPLSHEGFSCTLHRQTYDVALGWGGFCGAGTEFSNWMERQDILDALKHFGFANVQIHFDHPDHQNGPSFALIASK